MAGTLSVQTIQGLATAADPTTVSIASGHTLHAPGHVIQVVQGTDPQAYFETNSTSGVDVTGFTATITPSSASSKILVSWNGRIDTYASTYVNCRSNLFIVRGSSTVIARRFFGFYIGDASPTNRNNYESVHASVLDSPNTTSAVTYKLQVSSNDGNVTTRVVSSSDPYNSFLLMEIAQ